MQLRLIVSGTHLAPEFGSTVDVVSQDGFEITDRIETLLSSDSPEAIGKSIGLGTISFAQAFGISAPDILVVLGDRFEMLPAVLAALPFKIPVAHLHGGESTEGLIDESIRHAITKLSHLHFASTERYALRIAQLGEEPWRISVSGAPSLDNLRNMKRLTAEELEAKCGLSFESPPLLVTFHPTTLESDQIEWQVGELLAALHDLRLPLVFTGANSDLGGRTVRRMLQDFVDSHPSAALVESFGTQGFFSMMSIAAAMVGNSSSGIIEAPSLELPAVNIGTRQQGRIRGNNVIDVAYPREEIQKGLRKALSPSFRARLRGVPNPYGDGSAAERIVSVLKSVCLDNTLLVKRFNDIPPIGVA